MLDSSAHQRVRVIDDLNGKFVSVLKMKAATHLFKRWREMFSTVIHSINLAAHAKR
jgi:hypothetical protein